MVLVASASRRAAPRAGDARDGPDAHGHRRRPARHAGPAGADPRSAGARPGHRRPRPGRDARRRRRRPRRSTSPSRPARRRRARARRRRRATSRQRRRRRAAAAGGNAGGGTGTTKLPSSTPATRAPSTAPTATCARARAARATRRKRRRRRAATQPRRLAHAGQPDLLAVDARPGAHRRPELLHRQVPHPALPAPDLPGRRHPVRRPLGGPRGDQRDRDRLRPQPQRELRRRARLDAVHARRPGGVYGVDANGDGVKDPYNPVDAIFAAARYLRAAGADQDIRQRGLRLQPRRLVRRLRPAARAGHRRPAVEPRRLAHRPHPGPLPGPGQGHATPTTSRARGRKRPRGQRRDGRRVDAAAAASTSSRASGAPVVAVNDGRIVRIGAQPAPRPLRAAPGRLRQHVHVRAPGQGRRPLPGAEAAGRSTRAQVERELELPTRDAAAGRGRVRHADAPARQARRSASSPPRPRPKRHRRPTAARPSTRSACSPTRRRPNASAAGGAQQVFERTGEHRRRRDLRPATSGASSASTARTIQLKRLRVGARVVAGTILGRLGEREGRARPYLRFEIRPAGRGAPRDRPEADPRRLEAARVDRDLPRRRQEPVLRPRRREPVDRPDPADEQGGARPARARQPARSTSTTAAATTSATGQIDRRVLATLEFLAASGLRPTVTSLRCGHGFYTTLGQRLRPLVRQRGRHRGDQRHPDLAGHQGAGSITEMTIQRLLTLQGTMKPHQIISLMKFEGTDNTFAMGDHDDHIHVGLPAALRHQLQDGQAGQRDPQAQAVDQADRPPRRDRQPDGPPQAVEVRASAERALHAAQGRVAAAARRRSASSSGSSRAARARARALRRCAATPATTCARSW